MFAPSFVSFRECVLTKLYNRHLNFPAAQVSSATADPSATEAVFKTADSDSGLDVVVTDIPSGTGAAGGVSTVNTATLTTGVVVTQATDSADGHKPGDFLFQIKDQGRFI